MPKLPLKELALDPAWGLLKIVDLPSPLPEPMGASENSPDAPLQEWGLTPVVHCYQAFGSKLSSKRPTAEVPPAP